MDSAQRKLGTAGIAGARFGLGKFLLAAGLKEALRELAWATVSTACSASWAPRGCEFVTESTSRFRNHRFLAGLLFWIRAWIATVGGVLFRRTPDNEGLTDGCDDRLRRN